MRPDGTDKAGTAPRYIITEQGTEHTIFVREFGNIAKFGVILGEIELLYAELRIQIRLFCSDPEKAGTELLYVQEVVTQPKILKRTILSNLIHVT